MNLTQNSLWFQTCDQFWSKFVDSLPMLPFATFMPKQCKQSQHGLWIFDYVLIKNADRA